MSNNAKHLRLVKRQRDVTIPVDATDAPASTRARTRTSARTSATDAQDEEPALTPVTTTTSRVRPPRTSTSVDTAVSTSSQQRAAVTSATPLSPTTSNTNLANSASASPDNNSSGPNTGAIAGAVVAVIAVILIALGIFFFVRRKKAKQAVFGSSKPEKDEDERSFIGGSGLRNSEKGGQYGMSNMGYGGMNQSKGDGPTGWEDASALSYVHTPPSDSYMQSQQQAPMYNQPASSHPYAQPPAISLNNGFAPPAAAMMGAPSKRLSVQNPYGAAAPSVNNTLPPAIITSQQPQGLAPVGEDTEDTEGPFADPEWAGKIFVVVRSFVPSQPDELLIKVGDKMQIMIKYDDDWCLGYNLTTPQTMHPGEQQSSNGLKAGVFPFNCVEESVADSKAFQAQNGADLHRVPTLPPMDMGNRVSTTFASEPLLARDTDANKPSSAQQHLSTDSLNQDMLNDFPTPRITSPQLELARSEGNLKRSSSLLADKDAALFAQLGRALDSNNDSPELR